LQDGITISLDSGLTEELSLAGVLEALCTRASVTIDEFEAIRLRKQVERENGNEKLKLEVQRLLAHLSRRIEEGKYRVHTAKPGEQERVGAKLQPEERLLYEAIELAQEYKIPVCMDDRMVRQHPGIGSNTQLCDCWDILHTLQARGIITADAFCELRTKMRAANIRYLPITAEEVITYLFRAPIQNEGLPENPEMACLRRYVAGTLSDFSVLQPPLFDAEGKLYPRENMWAVRLHSVSTTALVEVWKRADLSTKQAELQATWIWNNLWFDHRLFSEFTGQKLPDGGALDARLKSIGFLFALGINFNEKSGVDPNMSRRRRYFQWLVDCAVLPLQPNAPALWDGIAEPMRDMIQRGRQQLQSLRISKGERSHETIALKLVLAAFVADLPARLAHALKLEATGLAELGLTDNSPSVELLGLVFPASEFWRKASIALRKGHASLPD
jgi:hypothetical protein